MTSSLSNGILIRHATPTDVESYRELRLEALKNHPDAFGQDYIEAASNNQEYWENRLQIHPNENALFLAQENTQLVGMAGVHRNTSQKAKHAAMIWGVYVKPNWRGRHISESLVRSCLDWAKEQGLAIVKLAVVTTNQPAVRCYERCGFTIYGTEPKASIYDGVYYDGYLMAIEIEY